MTREFRSILQDNRFRGGNSYITNNALPVPVNFKANDEFLPIIVNPPQIAEYYRGNYELKFYTDEQFWGKTMTKPKIIEVMKYSYFIIRVKFNGVFILIGKAFLAIHHDNGLIEILMIGYSSIENKNWDNDIHKWFISFKVRSDVNYRPYEVLINLFLADGNETGDVIYTKDLSKYTIVRLKIPKLTSVKAKKVWEKNLITKSINEVKKNYGIQVKDLIEQEKDPTFVETQHNESLAIPF